MADTDGDSRYHLPPVRDGKPEVLTEQRKKRGDVVTVEGERGGTERRSLTIPLHFYVARRYITGEQYDAGERLHSLWRGSILAARFSTSRYGDSEGGYDPESMSLMPRDYIRAVEAIRSDRSRGIVCRVCCYSRLQNRVDVTWGGSG